MSVNNGHYHTLYTHHCDNVPDGWRTRIMPDIDTTNHSEFAYDQAGTLVWQEATEDLRIQHREVLNSEMAVYVKHLGVAAKQQTVEAGTPHILSLDIKSKSANTSNAMILIADKDSYDNYGAAMLMGNSPALIYVWQEMPDTGLQQFIFTPLHDEIVIAILHGTSSVGGHLDFDDVKIIKHTPIVHEIFDTSIVPWRSTLTEPQADTTYVVGSLECDSTNQKLKVHLAMFDNPYMDANTMTALALKPINVQPNSRYKLKVDVGNGNFGVNDSLIYGVVILNGNEYAEQGFTATVLTEQATENIIEPSDLFNTHTLSFTTDAATNNIVLQVFMMLNDSTQNNLYFTINNVTLEEIRGGLLYSVNNGKGGYRYGFNGQERETTIKKGTYSAEFWMYSSQIGRRWNTDPVVKPWESSYAVFGNNPIYFNDVKGDDYGITTKKDDNGDIKEIKVSATVYIQNHPDSKLKGANEAKAKELTDLAAKTYKTKIIDGVKVSFDVKYVYGENVKVDKLNAKQGENILMFYSRPEDEQKRDVSKVYTPNPEGQTVLTAKGGQILGSGKDNTIILHETMHLIGFSDRYGDFGVPDAAYKNTIMGTAGATKLHINQYKHIIEYTKKQHETLTKKYPNLKYIWSNQKMDTKGVDKTGKPILKD